MKKVRIYDTVSKISGQILATVSSAAIIVTCVLFEIHSLAFLYDETALLNERMIPVVYAILSITLAVLFLYFSLKILWHFASIKFFTASHIFPALIMLIPLFAWYYDSNMPGSLNSALFILSLHWIILAIVRASSYNYVGDTKHVEDKTKKSNQLPILLQSKTAQKMLAHKISQLQENVEKNLCNEFDEIRKEYIIKPIDEHLQIEPAIEKLVEENADYLLTIRKIAKRISEKFQ